MHSCIALMAAQSSSSSLVRPIFGVSALLAHCWSFFSGGSNATVVGFCRMTSVNGLDHVKRSLLQSGPVVSDMLRKALPTLSLERLPLMAVVP